MRRIEWEPGIYTATKERASALAWATNRRGRNPWVGKNVTSDILAYLADHGYVVDSRYKLLTTMKSLVNRNYAYIHFADGGKKVKEFGFFPDVDLNGHGLPEKAKKPEPVANPHIDKVVEDAQPVKGYAGPAMMPPLPAAPEPPIYRLDELVKNLKKWHEGNPETFASWIDAAIESLQENG